jgi:hypothetical protein
MWVIRGLASARFDSVFGPSAPVLFGAAAFGLVLFLQMLSLLAGRDDE